MTEKNPAQIIKKSFIISSVLLFYIVVAYQSVIFIQTWTEDTDANKVNISGRQRMLSERVGKNLLLAAATNNITDRDQLIKLVAEDVKTLAINHSKLATGDISPLFFAHNKKITTEFTAINKSLTSMITATHTVQAIKKNLPLTFEEKRKLSEAIDSYLANEKVFLPIMDEIVNLYETDLQYYVTQLKWLSWLGAATILLVMFINGRFVVYKAIKAVEKQFAEIERNKEFQETILSCSQDGIVSINKFGCITLLNSTAEKLFNVTEKESLGRRITALLPEFNLHQIAAVSHYYEAELEGRKKGGSLFPLLMTISKIETTDKQGWVIFMRDLTIRKKIERELVNAKQKVIDAVDATNAKSQFLANMGHELRTPLNSIIGFSQLLQTDNITPLNSEHAQYVGHIHEAGSHLLSLINEILDLANLESGKLTISLEMINISKIIEESLILVHTLASKKHIQIYNQFASEKDYFIIADRVRIKQVLLNLMSNAIKYNNNNGKIDVTLNIIDYSYLRINVIDNGRGIPENGFRGLFEPFNRLGAENSDIEGTGIGLTITKSLVEDMHGKIGVVSEEHKGSNFWVEFPLASREEAKELPEIQAHLTIDIGNNRHSVFATQDLAGIF